MFVTGYQLLAATIAQHCTVYLLGTVSLSLDELLAFCTVQHYSHATYRDHGERLCTVRFLSATTLLVNTPAITAAPQTLLTTQRYYVVLLTYWIFPW